MADRLEMADDVLNSTDQTSVEMPNGVVLTGVGEHDAEAAAEQFEQRQEERTGQPAPTEDEKPRKVTRGQKRFDELTAERESEKRRADAAEQRAKDLEEKLRIAAPPQAAAETKPVETKPETKFTRPKPEESEVGTKYTTLGAYFEDLADWKAEQREAALIANFDARLTASIEADRASRSRTDYVGNVVFPAGRAAYPDFDAVLDSAKEILIPPAYQDAILKMPNPEHIMYALGKDHTALKALLAETDAVRVGARLASLVRPAEAVASPASTPAAVRTSNAPPPPQPVGAGTRTAQPSLAELAASGNYDAYKVRRAADRGVH